MASSVVTLLAQTWLVIPCVQAMRAELVQAPMVSIAAESALRTRLADGASVIIADIPASWQEARAETRSHDSHRYGTRFMLRLDEPSQTKLQQLVNRFRVSQATR